MPNMIRQGDSTSHGGTVLEGFSAYLIDGRAAAGLGHMVSCPQCKGVFPIAQGNPAHTYNNTPLAYHGMVTACGATLLSSQSFMTHTSPTGSMAKMAESLYPHYPLRQHPESREVQFVVKHHVTKAPLANVPYKIRFGDGRVELGTTDSQGLTAKYPAERARDAELELPGKSSV